MTADKISPLVRAENEISKINVDRDPKESIRILKDIAQALISEVRELKRKVEPE